MLPDSNDPHSDPDMDQDMDQDTGDDMGLEPQQEEPDDAPAPRPANDEALLVERARNGDEQALVELLRKPWCAMHRLALARCTCPDAAEEAVQSTLLRILLGIRGFRGDATFSSWAFRILFNQIKSLATKERRRHDREREAKPPENTEEDLPTDDLIPEEHRKILWNAVQSLPPNERNMLLLTIAENKTIREAAEQLDLSVGKAKGARTRGLRALRGKKEIVAIWGGEA